MGNSEGIPSCTSPEQTRLRLVTLTHSESNGSFTVMSAARPVQFNVEESITGFAMVRQDSYA